MTLQTIISTVETELNSVVNLPPVKRVMFGEINPNRFESPSILFELVSANANDLQVINPNHVSRDLEYKVTVMHSGAEAQQTVKNAQTFVNEIYRRLQRESAGSRRLNNNCLAIGCPEIQYGEIGLDLMNESVLLYGGIIKLIVRIVETDATT